MSRLLWCEVLSRLCVTKGLVFPIVHGSAMSLISTASSSLYSTPEDKQAHEMRRLKKDLTEAQQKVHTLTSQLSTNVSSYFLVVVMKRTC